jgi:predicted nucleotidyltransferase
MLSNKEIEIIINILKPFNPKRIGLFGSVARNEETPSSDIDILYTFQSPITLFTLVDLQNKLQKELKKGVDLVSEKAIHPGIKEYILNDLKIIYGS